MKLSNYLRGGITCAISLFLMTVAGAQWTARYNHQSLDDIGECVAVDKMGNVYVAGTVDTTADDGDLDVVVHSYTAAGVARSGFPATYNGVADGDDFATAIHVDDDLNVYISGTSWGGSTTNYDLFVWKLRTSGAPVWPTTGSGTGYAFDASGAVRTTTTTQ